VLSEGYRSLREDKEVPVERDVSSELLTGEFDHVLLFILLPVRVVILVEILVDVVQVHLIRLEVVDAVAAEDEVARTTR
jgi:hypothetical protein